MIAAVALRKESVDRNAVAKCVCRMISVALRKESVDRNPLFVCPPKVRCVALRKESVDRNLGGAVLCQLAVVALRKESVDRNKPADADITKRHLSLSARRAWIEIRPAAAEKDILHSRSPQGERG